MAPQAVIRYELRPGDLGNIVSMHGRLYASEYDLDITFEPYVARPLADFVLAYAQSGAAAGKVWLADDLATGRLIGSVAMLPVEVPDNPHGHVDAFSTAEPAVASTDQLRWFLLDPAARGQGLGRRLLDAAIEFSRQRDRAQVILWTFDELAGALALYQAAGFVVAERKTAHVWGRERTELKMILALK